MEAAIYKGRITTELTSAVDNHDLFRMRTFFAAGETIVRTWITDVLTQLGGSWTATPYLSEKFRMRGSEGFVECTRNEIVDGETSSLRPINVLLDEWISKSKF